MLQITMEYSIGSPHQEKFMFKEINSFQTLLLITTKESTNANGLQQVRTNTNVQHIEVIVVSSMKADRYDEFTQPIYTNPSKQSNKYNVTKSKSNHECYNPEPPENGKDI